MAATLAVVGAGALVGSHDPLVWAAFGGASRSADASLPALSEGAVYPWHTTIVATTFWVGEVFDPDAEDGSQMFSTYDSRWFESYGGCDGVMVDGVCRTEPRAAAHGYFPTGMRPRENPFYLDLPVDDVNVRSVFERRGRIVPWAGREPWASHVEDPGYSLMKNRWVELRRDGRTCYGQIEDAGPGEYDDVAYVFGADDRRPANERYGGAGLDVSPALTACLRFPELNGDSARVDWRFVEFEDVPPGPWRRVVTTSQVR